MILKTGMKFCSSCSLAAGVYTTVFILICFLGKPNMLIELEKARTRNNVVRIFP